MVKTIGRNTNRNDTAVLSSAIALNATTSTTIASADSSRIFASVSNEGPQTVWIKLQAASVDNDKKGIRLPREGTWEMPMDNIYTGEISAIADTGTPNIFVTDY